MKTATRVRNIHQTNVNVVIFMFVSDTGNKQGNVVARMGLKLLYGATSVSILSAVIVSFIL